jgi:antitoxin ParD1/3/4
LLRGCIGSNICYSIEDVHVSQVEKLSIALTTQQADMVREAVDSGEYATASEVIRDAMRVWQEKWEARQADIRKMRLLWDEGIASGKPKPIDFDELREEARRLLKGERADGREA